MVALATHVQADVTVEMKAELFLKRQDDGFVCLARERHRQVVAPGETAGQRQVLFLPAEIEVFDQLVGDDAQQFAHEIGFFVYGLENLLLAHQVSGNAEGAVRGVGQGGVLGRVKNGAALETDRILFGHGHHGPAVVQLAGVDAAVDKIDLLQPSQIRLLADPAAAHPGDIVI